MISNSFFSSDLSVYSSLFSFDGSCSSSPCLKTTFPWRLYPRCLLTLHSLWGSYLCLFTHYWWLPYIFFEPTLFFRTSESRISFLLWIFTGVIRGYLKHVWVQDSYNPSPKYVASSAFPCSADDILLPTWNIEGYLRLLSLPCSKINCLISPVETVV